MESVEVFMSKQIKADILLLVITAIWGSSFALMKNALEHIPSFAYLSLRFIIAAVILVIIFRKRVKKINKKLLVYGSIIGLMLFGGMALQVSGLRFTSASNSAFITGLNVVMVPVVSAVFLRKKPGRTSIIGVVVAFGGLFFLSGGLNFRFNIGDFLTLLCAVCFTFQIIFIDKYTEGEDPVLLAVLQIAFAAVLNTFLWLGFDYKPFQFNSAIIVTLVITGVLGTAFAYAGQTIIQRFTSPTRTALIFTAEPVFGAFFALVIPNSLGMTEVLTINTIVGCLLILGGMLISEIRLEKKGMDIKIEL